MPKLSPEPTKIDLRPSAALPRVALHALTFLLSAPPVIPYVAEPPVVDGLRDDSAWTEALVLDDLRVIEPNVGADPTDPIEVRLVKDQEALWVLFRCWDSAPETIRAVQRGRDPDFSGDDCVYIAVDPVGSRREGRVFSVGAGGGMGDSAVECQRPPKVGVGYPMGSGGSDR